MPVEEQLLVPAEEELLVPVEEELLVPVEEQRLPLGDIPRFTPSIIVLEDIGRESCDALKIEIWSGMGHVAPGCLYG